MKKKSIKKGPISWPGACLTLKLSRPSLLAFACPLQPCCAAVEGAGLRTAGDQPVNGSPAKGTAFSLGPLGFWGREGGGALAQGAAAGFAGL